MKKINFFLSFIIYALLMMGNISAQSHSSVQGKLEAKKTARVFSDFLESNTFGLSPARYLKTASPGFDKSTYYDREKGFFYFIDRNGRTIQSFNLRELNLEHPGHMAWNPDGTMVLASIYNLNKGRSKPLYLFKMDGSIQEVVSAEGHDEQILQPCWSFDGKWFAYLKSSRANGHEINIKKIDSDKEIPVNNRPIGQGYCGNPVWFNTKYKLLYKKGQRNRPNPLHEELWIYDLATKQDKKIYEGIIGTSFPIISPDDSLIGLNGYNYFMVMNENGKIVNRFKIQGLYPSWSPDGLKLAYKYTKVEPIHGEVIRDAIYCVTIDDGTKTNLTPIEGLKIGEYRWLDNQTIIYE